MKKEKSPNKTQIDKNDNRKSPRNFPTHTLEEALVLAQKIQDEMGGMAMNRLLLAQALGVSPSSSNFRILLSSSYKYGLTDGTEKADNISLTDAGKKATQTSDQASRLSALRKAALTPSVFGRFFSDYSNKKVPSSEMLPKILVSQYEVPADCADECAARIVTNGRFVDIVRDIGGSPHVLLDTRPPSETAMEPGLENGNNSERGGYESVLADDPVAPAGHVEDKTRGTNAPKPIFVGHGKNKGPLQQLQTLLTTFQIPHKVVVYEPNLGRPIPQKVKDTIEECGSAILIFTKDEKLFDEERNEVWRPSENVVHELGATSFKYGDRIVIFKEKGLNFPTNFQSIGYIEFESGDLTARTADLLKELIGFGLVKVTPTQ